MRPLPSRGLLEGVYPRSPLPGQAEPPSLCATRLPPWDLQWGEEVFVRSATPETKRIFAPILHFHVFFQLAERMSSSFLGACKRLCLPAGQPALPRASNWGPVAKVAALGGKPRKDGKDGQGLRQKNSCSASPDPSSFTDTWAEIFPTTNIWLLFPSPHPNLRLPTCSQTDWRLCKHAPHRSLCTSPRQALCTDTRSLHTDTWAHTDTRAHVWVHHGQQSCPQGPCGREHSHACLHTRGHTYTHSPLHPRLSDEGAQLVLGMRRVLHCWGLVSLDLYQIGVLFPNLPQGWPYGKQGKP